MAHTYVILNNKIVNDKTEITLTVDGFSVTIEIPTAQIAAQPNTAAVQALIAPIALNAATQAGAFAPVANPAVTAAGTFRQ